MTKLCQSGINNSSHKSDTDRGAATNSKLQRGHPVKQLKGKAAEIGTEASVPVGTTVNTGCTPVKKTEGLSETYKLLRFKGSA